MNEHTVILPLEAALRQVYAERRLDFPDRVGIRVVLAEDEDWLACYETEDYPVNAGEVSNEVLRLSRKIETESGVQEINHYISLVYVNEGDAIKFKPNVVSPDFNGDLTDRGAEQYNEFALLTPGIIGAIDRIAAVQGYTDSQDLLVELARDYMAMVTIARENWTSVP
tara:strand:+ start:1093 stop:1596 length:504 start_codon:yes stop_codon:yes gene_type:complete